MPGFEPMTYGSESECATHCTTATHKCWLIRTTHFNNFFHQLTIMITILENDLNHNHQLPAKRTILQQSNFIIRSLFSDTY